MDTRLRQVQHNVVNVCFMSQCWKSDNFSSSSKCFRHKLTTLSRTKIKGSWKMDNSLKTRVDPTQKVTIFQALSFKDKKARVPKHTMHTKMRSPKCHNDTYEKVSLIGKRDTSVAVIHQNCIFSILVIGGSISLFFLKTPSQLLETVSPLTQIWDWKHLRVHMGHFSPLFCPTGRRGRPHPRGRPSLHPIESWGGVLPARPRLVGPKWGLEKPSRSPAWNWPRSPTHGRSTPG